MKRLEGYDFDYYITESGEVYKGKRRLKEMVRHGHVHVQLRINKRLFWRRVATLALTAYKPEGVALGKIWHIDGDRLNNNISNLEWINVTTWIDRKWPNSKRAAERKKRRRRLRQKGWQIAINKNKS